MPLAETVLATIAQKVFNYALDQGQSKVVDWARDKLGREPRQQAFKRALSKAYKKFEKQYPQWAASLFNASFLEHEGAPILAEFLVRDGHPGPSDLAICWADSLNTSKPGRRTALVRELEPAASDFLDYMAYALKAEAELSDLNDSRTFEQLANDLKAIRRKLDAEQATTGTYRDYLHWLIERNLYLDPRGTFQTQRQVQMKLDKVYISLRAQRVNTPGDLDRRLHKLLEQLNTVRDEAQKQRELAEKRLGTTVSAKLPSKEIEDQHEHLLASVKVRFIETKNVPGEVLELAEVVNRHDRLVILGDPGGGKSTLLRHLALQHTQALWDARTEVSADLGVARFPILIRIADYAEHGMPKGISLSDFLADYHTLHECPKFGLDDLLTTELAAGNCLVLLDGLDEIVNADERRKVVERVEDFIRHHGNRPNRFIITSRIAGYRSAQLGEPFAHYTVQEMDETQIQRFLERWCTEVEAAQTPDISPEARQAVAQREIDAIMKIVRNSPGVRRLAANPLLLRTLALIHRTGAQLPQRRIELYKLAADTLARTWRTAQGVPESQLVEDRYLTRLLGRLAYWLHANKSTGIATEQEVYRELGQEWTRIKGSSWEEDNPDIEGEVKKFLRAVREHTGMFVEQAPRRYGFMHLTFEEYFTARYLVARSKERAKLIRQHLHKPRWEEPILLALGFVGLDSPDDAAELLETAIMAEGEEAEELSFTPSPYEYLLGRDYLFALRCLGDNIPTRPRFMQKLIGRLVDELLHRTNSARFNRYRQALSKRLKYLQGSEAASALLPHLINAMHDADEHVRYAAAESLGQLGQSSPEVVKALDEALDDANDLVRNAAAESLGQLGQSSPEAVRALISALHDTNDGVRAIAAYCLGQFTQSYPEVAQWLSDALYDYSDDVRYAATMSLGLFQPSRETLKELIEALDDTDAGVRNRAAQSLGYLGQSSPEMARTLLDEMMRALIDALHDADGRVRSAAAKSLGQLGQSSNVAVRALIDETVKALIDALHDADDRVRNAAAESLGQLGQSSPEVSKALVASLDDANDRVRNAATESLGQLGQSSPEAVRALNSALHDANDRVRNAAAGSLGQLGHSSPEANEVLLETLRDAQDSRARNNAVRFLGQFGQSDEQTVQTLWRGLLDEDAHVRTSCARALARLTGRFPDYTETIERKLIQAIIEQEFDKADGIYRRSGHDYAHEGLWLIAVGDEIDGDSGFTIHEGLLDL